MCKETLPEICSECGTTLYSQTGEETVCNKEQVEEEKAIVSVTRDFYKKIKKYMEESPVLVDTWACPKCKTVWELRPLSLDMKDGSMLCPVCYLKEAKIHGR